MSDRAEILKEETFAYLERISDVPRETLQPGDITALEAREKLWPNLTTEGCRYRLDKLVQEGKLIKLRVIHPETHQPATVFRKPEGA